MLIAVYLSSETIMGGAAGFLPKRLLRLYVPFLAWGFLYFVIYSIHERTLSPLTLLQQWLIGVPACPPLYFMFLLAINTILLYLVCRYCHHAQLIFICLAAVCVLMQYSGLNSRMFAGLSLHPAHALGRFAELLPAAVGGLLLRDSTLRRWIGVSAVVWFLIMAVSGCHFPCKGFSYQGLYILCGAVGISSLAIELGERIQGVVSFGQKEMIKMLAGLTAGVYYIHLLVGKTLESIIGRQRSMLEALAVFVLSAVCVFLMKKAKQTAWLVR